MGTDATGTWTAPDGARIFYRLRREAAGRPVLVLLHGAASNSTRWTEFARETRLVDSCDLLRIDRRGQGRSVWRGATGIPEWCDDIAGILAAEGYGRAFVGGHCLGANIAIEFAARHRALTAGLVLVEPMPREALAGTMGRLSRWPGPIKLIVAIARALNALGLYRRKLADLDLEELDRRTREQIAAGRSSESALALYASPFLDLTTTPTVSYFRDLLAITAPLPPLASVDVPVLALISRDSSMTDPQRVRRAISAFPEVTCIGISARHWIPTEEPAAMRSAIEDWLALFLGV
jgi:pimeloyl-ACP methyl ester carboxylesterase